MPIRDEGLRGAVEGTTNPRLAGVSEEDRQRSIKRRFGGLTPGNRTDQPVIDSILERDEQGLLPADEKEYIIYFNPRLSEILKTSQVAPSVRIGRQFFRPAQPAVEEQEAIPFADPTAGVFADEAVPGFEAQPQGLIAQEAREPIAAQPRVSDVSGAVHQALSEGRTKLASEFAAFDEDTEASKQKLGDVQFKRADTLRDEHTKLSKTFIDVRDAYGRIIESGTEPSAAGDLALIFNYMKMLDPDSVVRESEFATAAASGSLGDRFIAVGNRMARGERLSARQRLDFMDRSKRLYDRQIKTQRRLDGRYSKLSGNFRIPSRLVVQDFALEKGADNILKQLIQRRSTKPISKPNTMESLRAMTPQQREARKQELLRKR